MRRLPPFTKKETSFFLALSYNICTVGLETSMRWAHSCCVIFSWSINRSTSYSSTLSSTVSSRCSPPFCTKDLTFGKSQTLFHFLGLAITYTSFAPVSRSARLIVTLEIHSTFFFQKGGQYSFISLAKNNPPLKGKGLLLYVYYTIFSSIQRLYSKFTVLCLAFFKREFCNFTRMFAG